MTISDDLALRHSPVANTSLSQVLSIPGFQFLKSEVDQGVYDSVSPKLQH